MCTDIEYFSLIYVSQLASVSIGVSDVNYLLLLLPQQRCRNYGSQKISCQGQRLTDLICVITGTEKREEDS